MSYLVLARKYRPTNFDEIIGQEHVTRTLANAFAKDRVHHAFLFCGPRGVGKTTAARALAKALCCEKGAGPNPCGVCGACKAITDGTAVDYFEIDGASNNRVDDVRELRDGVRYQPALLRRKIYVIDEVHMLTTSAFNALLKTLEEPPPHVTFVFATTEVHKLPITILSRCQRYDFKLVPQARLVAHLESIFKAEGLKATPGALGLLARESGGSVRDTLSLADQVVAFAGAEPVTEALAAQVLGVADRALLFGLAEAVLAREPGRVLEQVNAAVARGVDLEHLARAFLMTLRDLRVVKDVPDPEKLLDASEEERQQLAALVRDVPGPQLSFLFRRFAAAADELTRTPEPRLVLEVAFLDLATAEPVVEVARLMARLEALSQGGGAGPGGRSGGESPRGPGREPAGGRPAPGRSAAPESRTSADLVRSAAPESRASADLVRSESPAPSSSPAVRSESSAPSSSPAVRSESPAPSASSAVRSESPAPSASSAVRSESPAPSPPAAVRAGIAHGEDPVQAWEALLRVVEQRSATLASTYAAAQVLSWEPGDGGGVLELGFVQGSFDAQLGLDNDNLGRLRDALGQLGASAPAIKVRALAAGEMTRLEAAPTPASVAAREEKRRDDEAGRRRDEARSHPATRKVLETFAAEIKEIKIDG